MLDPFAGSRSYLAAALLTGRSYIGIELDAEYHCTACERLNRVKREVREAMPLPLGIPTRL